MNRLRRMWIPVLLQTAVALAACDDDDGDDVTDGGMPDASTDAGKDATVPTDGGTDAAVTSVMCGTTKCGPFQTLPGSPAVEPCCYSGPLANGMTAANTCSGKYMGTCLPPAVKDARCDNITVLGMSVNGCCAINGQCGLDSNLTGLGCQDLTIVGPALAPLGVTIPMGAKRACAADAGVRDGGTLSFIQQYGMDAGT